MVSQYPTWSYIYYIIINQKIFWCHIDIYHYDMNNPLPNICLANRDNILCHLITCPTSQACRLITCYASYKLGKFVGNIMISGGHSWLLIYPYLLSTLTIPSSVDAKVNLQTQRANTQSDIQSVSVDLTC
jgi:hypothetical protein